MSALVGDDDRIGPSLYGIAFALRRQSLSGWVQARGLRVDVATHGALQRDRGPR